MVFRISQRFLLLLLIISVGIISLTILIIDHNDDENNNNNNKRIKNIIGEDEHEQQQFLLTLLSSLFLRNIFGNIQTTIFHVLQNTNYYYDNNSRGMIKLNNNNHTDHNNESLLLHKFNRNNHNGLLLSNDHDYHHQSYHNLNKDNDGNIVPVFGILAQPIHHPNSTKHNEGEEEQDQQQYIAASYIKWLEMGGIRTIPIPYDLNNITILNDMFYQINGLFLPGGDSNMPFAIKYLLNRSIYSNIHENIYFPIWGTCLGYEFIIEYVGSNFGTEDDMDNILESDYEAYNMSLPLYNIISKELYPYNSNIYTIVSTQNVTFNNHHQGISSDNFYNKNQYLSEYFYITSINYDINTNKEFISTIEPIYPNIFPIYGIQYHPEKNTFEYNYYPNTTIPYENINHSIDAIELSFYLANFVGQLGKKAIEKQKQQKDDPNMQQQQQQQQQHAYTKPTIYPMVIAYPIEKGIAFEEVYIIPPASSTSNI